MASTYYIQFRNSLPQIAFCIYFTQLVQTKFDVLCLGFYY